MTALVAWVLEGVVLTAVVAAVLRLVPRLNASTRHLVWWATLAAVVILPLAPTLLPPWAQDPAVGASLSVSATSDGPLVLPAMPSWAAASLLGLWLGFVLLSLVRLARGVVRLAQHKRQSRPVPVRVTRRLRLWSETCRTGRPVRLRLSDRIVSPCALGLGRAVILLPLDLVDALAPDDLDQIVAHERAHLDRRDDWWRLLQAVIVSVAGAHPAVRWIARRIDLECETACDDAVIARTGRPHDYARCLSKVAHLCAGRRGLHLRLPALAPGAVRWPSVLRQRVGRLLDTRRNRAVGASWLGLAVGAAGIAVLVFVLAQAPPIVIVDTSASVAPPIASRARGAAGGAPMPSVVPVGPDILAGIGSPAQAADGAAVLPAAPRQGTPAEPGRTPATISARLLPLAVEPPSFRVEPAAEPPAALIPAVSWLGDHQVGAQPGVDHPPGEAAGDDPGGGAGGWRSVSDAGAAIGSASKRSGLAVGGFFTRTARTVASSFRRVHE